MPTFGRLFSPGRRQVRVLQRYGPPPGLPMGDFRNGRIPAVLLPGWVSARLRAYATARSPAMDDVIRIPSAIGQGDPIAAGQLCLLVYHELRLLGSQRLAQEGPGLTLERLPLDCIGVTS